MTGGKVCLVEMLRDIQGIVTVVADVRWRIGPCLWNRS